MTLRSLFVFIHVVSAMAVAGALAIEGASLLRLRRAAGPSETPDALTDFRLLRILGPVSLGLTVLSGMYLVRTVWGWHAAWINVALASLVLAAAVGVTGSRVAHLRTTDRADYIPDSIVTASFVMRTALLLGIVFLMTVKPDLKASLAAMGTAAVLGGLAGLAAVTTSIRPQNLEARVTSYALAVLLLTTIHHVYGAYVYHTPWRLDAAWVSAVAAAAIIGSLRVLRRHTNDMAGRIARWIFVGVTLVIPVAVIGLFEGGYNHALKDALYFAGASTSLMTRMFPAPTYELPNDAFFEITGVLQLLPAILTGWYLYRMTRSRRGASRSPHAAAPEVIGLRMPSAARQGRTSSS